MRLLKVLSLISSEGLLASDLVIPWEIFSLTNLSASDADMYNLQVQRTADQSVNPTWVWQWLKLTKILAVPESYTLVEARNLQLFHFRMTKYSFLSKGEISTHPILNTYTCAMFMHYSKLARLCTKFFCWLNAQIY